MIRHLPADVRAYIRTGFTLTSFAQTVEELVLNGIDAGASSIAVRVDFSCFKIQVVDNGVGISLDQFQLIGERYSTSKCQSIEDLDNLKYFGYRGEALASIRTASSFLEIVSRPKSSVITYSKCFQNGNVLDIIQASQSRPSAGTTVTLHDLFYNLPVRRKRLNVALEMEKIRYRIAGIALMWPHISLSLRDDSVGHVILQTHKCSGMVASFSYIFTPARARGLMEVSAERDEFKLTGIVSKECYSRMDLQFVFVNKRLVLKSSIHRQINKILGRSLILRRKGLTSEVHEKSLHAGGTNTGSPQKQLEKYAIFAVNVECPYNVYDITFDPSKTLVEFRDWPRLIHLLQDMLYGFLRKENLISITEPVSSISPDNINDEDDDDEENSGETTANFDNNILSQRENIKRNLSPGIVHKFGKTMSAVIENGLFSKPVHRQKIVASKSVLVSPEPAKPMTDQSKEHQAEATNQKVNEQSNESGKSTSYILDSSTNSCTKNESCQIYSDTRTAPSVEENNETNFKKHDEESGRKSKDQNIQQSSFPYSVSSENELVSTESLRITNRQNMNEDSEEIFVKGQTSLERREITLGSSVHYSSTLKSLRDIKQASSSRRVSEIITNTLQQLRQSTQKAVKSLGNIYKTPEKFTTVYNPSPTKQPKMDDGANVANSELNETRPVSKEFVSVCKSKQKKRFSYNLMEHSISNGSTNQVAAENVIRSNNNLLCEESNSSTFKSTKEDRSLGENDRGTGLKRTLDHRISHASKLAKLMRGENIGEKSQEIHAKNGEGPSSLKHTEMLNAFSYSRSLKNVLSKHSDAQTSSCISNKSFMDYSQITGNNSSEGMFFGAVNISPEHLSNDKGRTRLSDIEMGKVNEQILLGTSYNVQTSCSAAAAYSESCCCCTLCQSRKQLGPAGSDLPFRIFGSAVDMEQHTENEVDNSPKVSVILSLPLENVRSKISQSETWDRPETTRPVFFSDLNRFNETLENDARHNITEPKTNCKINGTITSHHSYVQKTTKHSTYQSLTGIEQMCEVPCLFKDQRYHSCQPELEAAHLESSTQTPEVSQGFTVALTQLNNTDNGTSLESANSPLVIHCTDSVSSVEESANGFESAGFSPTSNVALTTDEEFYPNNQSGKGGTLIQCPERKNTDNLLGINISQVVLLDSDSDINIESNNEREPRDNSIAVHCVGSMSSAESNSDNQITNNVKDNESSCSVHSKLTAHESISLKGSAVSNEPVILAYDSLNDHNAFSTVPETDDTENCYLDRMKNGAADVDLEPAAEALSKRDSKCIINSHCNVEDDDLIEVKSMIADAKHIFKNVKKSVGISESSHDLFCHSSNNDKKTASMLHDKHTFGHNQSSENCLRGDTEKTAYFQLEKPGNSSSRTFIHHTNDCEIILLCRSGEENTTPDSLNVSCASSRDSIPCGQEENITPDSMNLSCASSRDSIPCGQRNAIENNDATLHPLSSHTDSLTYKGTEQQTVLDIDGISPNEPSSPEHLKTTSCLLDPITSYALPKDIPDESLGHGIEDVNEKYFSQIPVNLACSKDEHVNNNGKSNSEYVRINTESQIYNTSKHNNVLNSEPLQDQKESRSPQLAGSKDLSSQTDLADIMSIEGDQVLMMIEEPDHSLIILSQESQIHEAENSVNESDSQSHKKALHFSAYREINVSEDWSETKNNSVADKEAQQDGAGMNDNHKEVTTCMAHPNYTIGLSTFDEVLIGRPTCLGSIEPNIVPSSLSLLRSAGLPLESGQASNLLGEHLFKADVSSENVDLLYKIESTISNDNTLLPARDVSNSENNFAEVDTYNSEKSVLEVDNSDKVIVELGIQMAESNSTTYELVHKSESPSNKKAVENQEGTATACWKAVTDPETGQQTYVNNQSGHTVNEEQWAQMSSQIQREMLTVPSEHVNVSSVSGPVEFSDSQKQAFKDLVNGHFEQEDNEAVSKWRKGERPTYDKNIEADVSALLASWKNPVFLNYKQPGLLADICPSGTVARSCFNSLSAVEFNKNMLNNLKVIGQLDNKFIACVIEKSPDITKATSSKSNSLLVLFDQHAVHERIRLEYFTRDVYEIENGERTDRIKRSEVRPAQSVRLDQDDLRIMKAFKQEFNRIGVSFSVDKASRDIVNINCFPSCLVDRDASEIKTSKIAGVIENVETLIKEHIELLKSTNGACGRLPVTIHKVLCSLACHGAVKFGDKLTLQECQDLLSSLATCSLPFQCAHGRPSVAPLVNLSVLEKELFSAKRRPNLRKISENLNKLLSP